jgi:hypothetical protein
MSAAHLSSKGFCGAFSSTLCHIKWLIFDIFYLDQLGFVGEDVTETLVTGAVRTFLKEGSDTSKNFSGKGWC